MRAKPGIVMTVILTGLLVSLGVFAVAQQVEDRVAYTGDPMDAGGPDNYTPDEGGVPPQLAPTQDPRPPVAPVTVA